MAPTLFSGFNSQSFQNDEWLMNPFLTVDEPGVYVFYFRHGGSVFAPPLEGEEFSPALVQFQIRATYYDDADEHSELLAEVDLPVYMDLQDTTVQTAGPFVVTVDSSDPEQDYVLGQMKVYSRTQDPGSPRWGLFVFKVA